MWSRRARCRSTNACTTFINEGVGHAAKRPTTIVWCAPDRVATSIRQDLGVGGQVKCGGDGGPEEGCQAEQRREDNHVVDGTQHHPVGLEDAGLHADRLLRFEPGAPSSSHSADGRRRRRVERRRGDQGDRLQPLSRRGGRLLRDRRRVAARPASRGLRNRLHDAVELAPALHDLMVLFGLAGLGRLQLAILIMRSSSGVSS